MISLLFAWYGLSVGGHLFPSYFLFLSLIDYHPLLFPVNTYVLFFVVLLSCTFDLENEITRFQTSYYHMGSL